MKFLASILFFSAIGNVVQSQSAQVITCCCSPVMMMMMDFFTPVVEVEPPQQLMSIGKRLDISCCGSSTSTEVYNWPSQSECSNVRLIYLRRHSLQRQHPAVTCLKSGKFPLADGC